MHTATRKMSTAIYSGLVVCPALAMITRPISMSLVCSRTVSNFGNIPMGPPDAILGLNEAFAKDPNPNKVTLGVGAYRDDSGKPVVLPSVREAEELLLSKQMKHEYAGIAGIPEFVDLSMKFAYGKDAAVIKEKRVAGIQSLSGTGACRVIGEFYSKFVGRGTPIYLPNPTWGNHIPIMKDAGLTVKQYSYYKPETCGLDFEGLMRDVEAAPDKSIFLIHACAHNPTGVDPSKSQWSDLSQLMLKKQHYSFFDCAYQGFASGNAEEDAWALRKFVEDGHCIALGQSYAKNFGLYGERVGALSIVGKDSEEADRLLSQLKIVVRPMYSNPPIYGARIVQTVLENPALYARWQTECKGMADRIISMRTLLRTKLESLGNGRPWNHITDQIGMFAFSGMTEAEVMKIRSDFSIYMTKDGRISMAGVSSGNLDYVANAIHEVITKK